MRASLPTALGFGGLWSGWRGLANFWGVVLLLLFVTGGVLQFFGPSPALNEGLGRRQATAPPAAPATAPAPRADTHGTIAKPQDAARLVVPRMRPGRGVPGPIAEADPGMLEPVAGDAKLLVPRISIDGRAPMSAYASGFDASTLRPRVGLLIAGIGMSEADSLAAIKALPAGVTLAVSPHYPGDLNRLLTAARSNEHEYLLSLPMEPQGYPINDPDDRTALMTSVSPSENMNRLFTTLGRVTGYAGVTNALGAMRGERLAGIADQFNPVLEEVAARGLFFLDARIGQKPLPYAWNRSVDMVVDDDPLDAATLDQRLEALTHLAQVKGSAVGVVSAPRPVTVDRVAAWANALASKGLALAPVSALMGPPLQRDQDK